MRVLLINMPFGLVERPALGLSLLKPALERFGFACELDYVNLPFAQRVGLTDYGHIANGLPEDLLAGEWIFGQSLFGDEARPLAELRVLILSRWGQSLDLLDVLRRLRSLATEYVEEYVDSVSWTNYGLVGFASNCHQNVAALAVARRVKSAYPEIPIVFGGSNWEGPMGVAQLEQFSFVDYACLGEAEQSLPALARRLEREEGLSEEPLPGVARRESGTVTIDHGDVRVKSLDKLPFPDYGDYLSAFSRSGLDGEVRPSVNVEGSRGCSWVRHGPCTFCGQNGTSRDYRQKGPARVLRELTLAGDRFPDGVIDITDNVVSERFIRGVLPKIVGTPLAGRLSLETRPTLSREDLSTIAAVAGRIQFGIESLNDHTLGLIHKGTNALENIRLLRWCRELGVRPIWNLLYGIPGETDADLKETIELLPALRFLPPPRVVCPISLDRFSTYFEQPERYGFSDVRPPPSHSWAYPLPGSAGSGFAYSFDATRSKTRVTAAYHFRLRHDVGKWQNDPDPGEARLAVGPGGELSVIDSRREAESPTLLLDPVESLVMDECADIATGDHLTAMAPSRLRRKLVSGELDLALSRLAQGRLLVAMGGRFLSLALPPLPAAQARLSVTA